MRIYLKRNSVKFHPDPILNHGALAFILERRPNKNKNQQNKMSSDIGSVRDPEIIDPGSVRLIRQQTFYSDVFMYVTTLRSVNFSVNWSRVLSGECLL